MLPSPDLVAAIEATADRTERDQRLATIDALHAQGLFRLLLPRSVGGHEAAPPRFLDTLEHLGRADASTAWTVAQTSVCSTAAARLTESVAVAIFADPAAILAWGHGAPGRAEPCQGGWIVEGTWSFGSGAHHATWLGGTCLVDGAPRMMLFPQDAVTFTAAWDTIGLRGTGSDSYAVSGLHVPTARSFRFADPVQPHARTPLYAFPPDSLWAAGFAAVALGVARAMLDSLLTLARHKTPRGQPAPLATSPTTQALIGEAEAAMRAARALLHQAVTDAFAQAADGIALDLARRMSIRLAASHALRTARQEGTRCYHAAGTTAVMAANPFERRLRDLHAITQHVHGRDQHFETVGAHLLGLEPELAFL